MLLLMITLPIIPYCIVLSLGKVPLSIGYYRSRLGSSDRRLSVKFILTLSCGGHMSTAGTLSTWAYLACEASVKNRKEPTFETELRALLKGQGLRQTKNRPD